MINSLYLLHLVHQQFLVIRLASKSFREIQGLLSARMMMRFVILLTSLTASVSAVNPRQTPDSFKKCVVPELRREW